MVDLRGWARFAVTLLLLGGLTLGFVSAQPENKKSAVNLPLPAVFTKEAPESVEDLRDIEKHVQKVLEKILPAVVGVRVGPGQGSGVIVSPEGLVLTAGHVSGEPNKNATVILPNGKMYKGKTLGRYTTIDSGMLKITEEGTYPYLDVGKSSQLKKGSWVIAIGHPGGYRANRSPVVRVGRVLYVDKKVIQTDCTLVGGDSGGPLFDMQGRVVGIHSRIGGGSITQNLHVPIDTYRETWDRLASGESWGGQLGAPDIVKTAGGKVIFEKKESLTEEDALDKVAMRGGEPAECYCKIYTVPLKAGATYTFDLKTATASKKNRQAEELDPFLRLESPAGVQVAEDDDGGGDLNSRIVYKALTDGSYKVIASSFGPKQTGAFILQIREASFKDAFVSGKVEVLRAIKLPAPAVGQVVDKFNLAKVPLHINAVLVDEKGAPLANKEIVILWEKGTETLKTNKEGVVRWLLLKDKSKHLSLQLPTGIRALLALTDQNGTEVPLKFGDRNIEAETVKSAGGKIVETINGTLSTKDPIDMERKEPEGKGYVHVHEFKMQPGKTYTIDLVSDDFDAFLRLEDPEGQKLAEDDDGAGFLNSRIVFTPTSEGVYRIVATSFEAGQTGVYRLIIREIDAKAPSDSKK